MSLLPAVPRDRLTALYHQASVYAQLSRTEGLPNVLCEAMLCGCTPIVTDVGAMAEVVAATGVVARAPDEIVGAVGEALVLGDAARDAARARIVEVYSRDLRRARLFAVIDRLAASAAS